MASTFRRLALTASLAGAALACGLAPVPAKAFTLIDNTNSGTAGSDSSVPTAGIITSGSKVAFAFNTNANLAPYNRFNLSASLSQFTLPSNLITPLSNITVEIFNSDANGFPTTSLYSKTFTSGLSIGYNNFYFDTVTPLLTAGGRYAFVFSSTDSSNTFWNINTSNIPFAASVFTTPIATSINSGSGWSTLAGSTPTGLNAAFYLQGVPGPLPVLGAGSAFAWSRRLRRRVNEARQASKHEA